MTCRAPPSRKLPAAGRAASRSEQHAQTSGSRFQEAPASRGRRRSSSREETRGASERPLNMSISRSHNNLDNLKALSVCSETSGASAVHTGTARAAAAAGRPAAGSSSRCTSGGGGGGGGQCSKASLCLVRFSEIAVSPEWARGELDQQGAGRVTVPNHQPTEHHHCHQPPEHQPATAATCKDPRRPNEPPLV